MNDNFYLVQLFAVVGGLLMPVLIVLFYLLFTYLGKKRQYRLAELMVEHDRELPENFFEKKDSMDSSVKLLKYGLIFLALGIGLAIFGWVDSKLGYFAISAIPALVGVAYIIVSLVVKKKEDKAELAEKEAVEVVETEPAD